MNTFVTSDLHFGHTNIMKYNPDTRKYRDVSHMNSSMIKEWNSVVTPNDTVYILGDVAFCNVRDAVAILKSLLGKKILVKGNHDRKLAEDRQFIECFESIHDYLTINYKSQRINLNCRVSMFHYPIYEWDQCHRGAVHLHGHVHGKKTGMEMYRVRDVGMDATGKVVSFMDDVLIDALKGSIKIHGDGEKE
jgi:calcineurin-like phosphoesterase family protein